MKWSTEFTLVSDFILIVLEITLHLYGLIKGQKGSIFQLYLTVFFRGNLCPCETSLQNLRGQWPSGLCKRAPFASCPHVPHWSHPRHGPGIKHSAKVGEQALSH